MGKWEDQLALFDRAVTLNGNFERKGKTVPYTSVNGHMFSILNKEGELGVRLSKEAGERFLQAHRDSGSFHSHGATMRGYVLVPQAMLKDSQALAVLLEEGHQYVLSLPPK